MNESENVVTAEASADAERGSEPREAGAAARELVCDDNQSWEVPMDFGQLNWGEGSWGRCSC